jgi:hypothetical protein
MPLTTLSGLWRAGRLLPTAEDRRRDRAEEPARRLAAVAFEAAGHIQQAWSHPNSQVAVRVAGWLDVLVYSRQSGEVEELWVAVLRRDSSGNWLDEETMHLVFAIYGQAAGAGDSDWEERPGRDWPTGNLEWAWVARLFLLE